LKAINSISHFIHKHFLLILLCAYGLAVILPGPGLLLRDSSIGRMTMSGFDLKISPPLIMLAVLLFNAGLGIKIQEIKHLSKKPALAICGFLANSLVPILLIFMLRGVVSAWHDQDELQNLLTGLALIVSMPIAGSSTAWSQNANGNLSLSLGLVLLSTVLSPLLTPMVLQTFSIVTSGDYAEDLQELAHQGSSAFLCITAVVPSLAGILLHFIIGEKRVAELKPILKFINFILLLTLNYSNAATSLPKAIQHPDLDFLFFILVATSVICAVAFGSGWLLSKAFKTDKADMASLMFGLGMNNNGTGLVLATSTLADHPNVLLPMIFYTLVQQVIAAFVDRKIFQE
jgi:bile acid:Na+ symporter, BASS family